MTITVKLVLATCMTSTVNQHYTHKNDVGAPAAFTHITPNSTPPLLQQEQLLFEAGKKKSDICKHVTESIAGC